MAVPKFFEFFEAFLRALQDGDLHTAKEVRLKVADDMQMSASDMAELLPSGRQTTFGVFCKHLMHKVACEKCTKLHVHFVHYCSGRAAGQATANISVISYFKIFLLSLRCVPLHYRTHLCSIL